MSVVWRTEALRVCAWDETAAVKVKGVVSRKRTTRMFGVSPSHQLPKSTRTFLRSSALMDGTLRRHWRDLRVCVASSSIG